MRNLLMSISILSLLMLVMVGCSEPLKNHGDLSSRVECMNKKGIKYEKRADGFYMSDDDWDKFISFCS